MNPFNYQQPADISEAIASGHAEGSAYIAGGTNLLDLWKYDLSHFDVAIDINRLQQEPPVSLLPDGGVRLNAFATNAATAYDPLVAERYPLLAKAILAGASPQIRNMATNGGNLLQRTRCYYFYDATMPCNKRVPGSGCPATGGYNRNHAILGTSENCIAVFPSDMCVALAALDAVIQVENAQGAREIPFTEFHRQPGATPHIDNNLQPGELITAIHLPPSVFTHNHAYLKLRDRSSYAFALVSVAMGLRINDDRIVEARIALGGVGTKPWRIPAAEAALIGQLPDSNAFSAAADILLEGATSYKFNHFKIRLAKASIVRCGLMALDPESQRPGAGPSK